MGIAIGSQALAETDFRRDRLVEVIIWIGLSILFSFIDLGHVNSKPLDRLFLVAGMKWVRGAIVGESALIYYTIRQSKGEVGGVF